MQGVDMDMDIDLHMSMDLHIDTRSCTCKMDTVMPLQMDMVMGVHMDTGSWTCKWTWTAMGRARRGHGHELAQAPGGYGHGFEWT